MSAKSETPVNKGKFYIKTGNHYYLATRPNGGVAEYNSFEEAAQEATKVIKSGHKGLILKAVAEIEPLAPPVKITEL